MMKYDDLQQFAECQRIVSYLAGGRLSQREDWTSGWVEEEEENQEGGS